MKKVRIHGKEFEEVISHDSILSKVETLSEQIHGDLADKRPIFLGLLNGSFLFAAELFKRFDGEAEIAFVRAKSYSGLESSGNLQISTLSEELVKDRHVLVIEDIVDSGNTLHHFLPMLQAAGPKSIRLASMLYKPEALQHAIHIDYCAFEIPDKFVVGFGLDYDGLGRNLPGIYSLAEETS